MNNECLKILTGKNHVSLNSAKKFIAIEAWLLLTCFICLHNQLIFIHFTVTYL